MITRIRTTLRREDGASAVEYGLLVAAIAALIVAVVFRPTACAAAMMSSHSCV